MRVEHIKHSNCRQEFLNRVKSNETKKTEGKKAGVQVKTKRMVSVDNYSVFEINGAPGAHNSADGRTIFGTVRPMCACFSAYYNTYTLGSALGKSPAHMSKCAPEIFKGAQIINLI